MLRPLHALCTSGCGRKAVIRLGQGALCEPGWQQPTPGCNGICNYQCQSCKKTFLHPDMFGKALKCPHCGIKAAHKGGRAEEEDQKYSRPLVVFHAQAEYFSG